MTFLQILHIAVVLLQLLDILELCTYSIVVQKEGMSLYTQLHNYWDLIGSQILLYFVIQ